MSEKFTHSFALVDADRRLVDWDEGFAQEFRFAGLTLKPGMPYAEILRAAANDPRAREFFLQNSKFTTVEALINDRLEGFGENRNCEYRTPSGTIIRVDEHRTLTGGVRRSTRDVTEERDAGNALTVANKWLDAGDSDLDSALTEIRRNPDGSYEFPPINEGVRRLLDFPPDVEGGDAMMVHTRMKASPEQDAALGVAMERSAETLEICSLEYRVWDGKNRLRWIRQSMMPRREPDGAVVFSGVMRDITREKEAEDQVELLRSVVVRSSDSIAIFETVVEPEPGTKILYVNEKFTDLFGSTAETLVGQPLGILRSRKVANGGAEMVAAALERGDSAPFEYESRSEDGHAIWIEARVMTVQTLEHGTFSWAGISRDVTERRHAQDELMRAKNAAEAGDRAKGEFLANMSHELRTPLNAIIGFTELIESGVARTGWQPAYTEYLADVSSSGRHLLALINTILDLSKIENGQLALSLDRVDLCELARSSLALTSGLARDGQIAVTTSIPLDCPGLEGDYLKLKQVLLNVLSNAIKFTPPGGKINVDVGFTKTDAVIAVSDTGCGIPRADLERVMLPFVQAGSTLSRKFDGSGLGLPIARELCSLHGGRLEIDSAEGQGTKVLISLPLAGPTAEPNRPLSLDTVRASRRALCSDGRKSMRADRAA